jgi:glycine/D-amino acid oxidase-like deaminating enzyme
LGGRLKQETGVDTRYHRCGGFVICLDDDEFKTNLEMLQALRLESGEQGYEYEVVNHAELKKRIPLIGNVAGATYCPHDGHCDPLRLLRALHAGYLGKGGEYRPRSRITSIRGGDGGGFELSTAGGEVVAVAEKLIVAAGHGSRELGSQVGLDVPIFPDQGQVLVTEKVNPVLKYPTNYVRQVGFDLSTEPGTLRDISQRCVKAFPALKSLRVQRVWAALRVMTPDGFPVYQQSDTHPGAFSFACHSGVTLQWIEDGSIPQQFRVFHPQRFHVQANTVNQ